MIEKINKLVSAICVVMLVFILYFGLSGFARAISADTPSPYRLAEKITRYNGKDIGQGTFVIYCGKESCESTFGHFIANEPEQMEVARDLVYSLNKARKERKQ